MSPSSASMSLASARRSTFRPETSVSCWSTTLRSPLCRVHPLLKRCSLGTGLTKVGAVSDSLPSRISIKETCADIDRETVVSSLLGSMSRGSEIVIKTLCKHRETGKISTKSLKGKLNWPREERNWPSKDYTKLRQTWRSSIGRREILILLFLRSQRSQLQPANQWAAQAQRDKISLYGELEMRNRLYRKNQVNYCQEIEELRRICCEETGRARQARVDELSIMKRGILRLCVSCGLKFRIHRTRGSSSGATHVPVRPPSPKTMPCSLLWIAA